MPISLGRTCVVSRRSFLLRDAPTAALGLAAALGASSMTQAEGGKTMPAPYYEFLFLRLQVGTQVARLLAWLEKRALPLFQKHHFGPTGFFTIEVGPYIPAVFGILAYPTLAEMEAAWGRMDADPEYAAALAELEKDQPAFYREDTVLLRATPFSPALRPAAPGDPRHKVFELRIYESPTQRQLGYLHERFAGGEVEIFHKSGIYPVLYADTIIGPNKPNMAYLIPFESEAHRETAWATFRENPEWQKLRDDSLRRGGDIVRNITNMIVVPSSFSLIR
jgi:hypothetical protein